MTSILGISAFYHDSAAAIVVDGVVVAAVQEERFSRIKHDASFPSQAVAYCLQESGLDVEDLDHVVFYEKPFLKFERILETHLQFAPHGFNSFRTAIPIWLKSKLYTSRLIYKGLNKRYRKRVVFPEHHQSHAAGAFYPSPFEQAAILTVDGAGEWATTTMGVGDRNRIEIHKQLNFPDSVGLLYSAFTFFCGFRVNGGEGKLMGLAPYGSPIYSDTILDQIIDLKADGSFRLDQSFFNYCTGNTMTSTKFDKLFDGSRRRPESEITNRERNLAASIQSVTETILLKMATQLHADTGMKQLCIAGGVGLNCVANGRLLRESPFESVWVQPASGDSGGAIGSALFVWNQLLDNPRTLLEIAARKTTAFLGPDLRAEQLDPVKNLHRSNSAKNKLTPRQWLSDLSVPFREFDSDVALFDEVAGLLASQKIVSWCQGRMEFGPRALGNRSILADPREPNMQAHLNKSVKNRETFRPFAPVVLAERCPDFFDVGQESRFMLFTGMQAGRPPTSGTAGGTIGESDLLPSVPAVTHVDGSARVQTVRDSENQRLHRLLKSFEQKTGCPILVNTSFNVRGEPMVCDIADAYRCFMSTKIDVLVVDNLILKKEDQPSIDLTITNTQPSFWNRLLASWKLATLPLRWLIANVALTLVFFGVVLPIGLIVRVVNRDSFQPIDRQAPSYWDSKVPKNKPTQYFKQY